MFIKNNNLKTVYFLFVICALLFTACKGDDDGGDTTDPELITTVNFTLTDGAGNAQTFSFRDVDGEGGNDPIIDNIYLNANTSYTGSIELLDESKTPAEDITTEVREHADDHIFIYSTTGVNITLNTTDVDEDNLPLGLESTLMVGDAGTGTMRIVLKHEADKSNPNATGETDVDVTFDVVVE